jgi:tryptophan-rich sensory protein
VPVVLAALAAILVAVLGLLATDLDGWYRALVKPAWQPPDWLFGPAWTLIFALAAIAGVRAWRGAPDSAARNRILSLFAINAFLNVFWSLLFFRLHRPDWALAEVVLLWLSIVALIVGLRPLSRAAAWLLLPYLAWVSFAAILNAAIVRLNPVS